MVNLRIPYAALGLAFAVAVAAPASAQNQAKSDPLSGKKQSSQTIGDWTVTCAGLPDGKKACAMSQTLANAKTKRPLAVWLIGSDKSGKMLMTLRTPAGVLLTSGVTVAVENQDAFAIPYRTCLKSTCLAVADLSSGLLGQLQKANKATVAFQSLQQKPISVSFSLKGFAKAYETYQVEAAKP